MWYDVAPDDAVHDTLIEVDEFVLAVTPVGTAGGDSVVADTGELGAKLPSLFTALIS